MAAPASVLALPLLLPLLLLLLCAASVETSASRVIIVPHPLPNAPQQRSAARTAEAPELEDTSREPGGQLGSSIYEALPQLCTALLPPHLAEGARVGNILIPPDSCEGGYYGHDNSLDPKDVLEFGLPARGTDPDLLHHALQLGNSAFRGTTKLITYPDGGGAAAWADVGGFVYEIACVPSWDVNKHLQGRRMITDLAVGKGRFAGNPVRGEYEHAIPARVPPEHIKRYGEVVESAGGALFVPRTAWVENPKWNPFFCRYCLSECELVQSH